MTKNTITKFLAPAALLGTLLAPMAAQAAPTYHHYPPSVGARLGDQERRIEQGERSGSLTPREAGRLQQREYRLERQDHRAHVSGGRFTPREHARLEREENRDSRAIYRQKHDAQHRY